MGAAGDRSGDNRGPTGMSGFGTDSDLTAAVFSQDLPLLRRLFDEECHRSKADTKLRHRDDVTLLHLAIVLGWADGVTVLVANGASVTKEVYYDGYGFEHLGFKEKLPIGPRSGADAIAIATRNGETDCLRALKAAVQPARQQGAMDFDIARLRDRAFEITLKR